MIRVLIVDDSSTARLVLTRELSRQPDFTVVGAAADAFEARRLVLATRPDVITLDLQMPGMSGLGFLEKLMAHHPLPVVIVSSLAAEKGSAALEALRLGAVEIVGKARLGADPAAATPLIDAIRAAGQSRLRRAAVASSPAPAVAEPRDRLRSRDVIAVGASTGGTRAIEALLASLPADIPGMVIAQHLPAAFTHSFAARLNAVSELTVREARHGDRIAPGTVLIAPGGSDTSVRRNGRVLRVSVRRRIASDGHSPSVDVLFRSVADACGDAAVGVLLTGMGSDGAEGMGAMRHAGAFTIAEHEDSCVVYGMPRAAIKLGAAAAVAHLDSIPALLLDVLARPAAAHI